MDTQDEVRTISADAARTVAHRLLQAAGVTDDTAGAVAGELVDADLRGVMTHGLTRLPLYHARVTAGTVRGDATISEHASRPGVAVLDANDGFGHLAGRRAMAAAVDRARDVGVGAVAVRNSTHFGAAGGYARRAAEQGCVGIVVSNGPPLLPPVGGAARAVGNNPLAIAAPSDQGFPLVLDIALSVVSSWKIQMAHERGDPIPDGWALDRHGEPTTDAYEAFAGGGLLRAVGDHKGFGLAMMVEVLSAALAGGAMTHEVRRLDQAGTMNTCHTFIALDVAAFTDPAAFVAQVGQLCRQVWETTRAATADRVLVPGQIEAETAAERDRTGIPYPTQVWAPVATLADEASIEHPFR